jgi:NADPH:quinone reductase-like Zn-dependent oxidoreductase
LAADLAGALPLVVLTGAQLVEKGVQPQAGQTVLITGALGSVGRSAVHVAKQHGAKVIAGVRANQKEDASSLGAERVVALDSDAEISALPLLDGIGDTVGGEVIGKLLPKLKQGGHLGSVLGKPANADKFDINVVAFMAQPDAARLHQLAEDVQNGSLKIPIAKRFPLSEAGEAQKFAEKGANGKVLITP